MPFPGGAVKVGMSRYSVTARESVLEYFSVQVKQNYRAKLENLSRNRSWVPFRRQLFRRKGGECVSGAECCTPMSTLGERIRLARGGSSQEAFSRALNISKGSLGFYERNENLPNADVILKICSKAGIGLEWLLTGEGPMRPADGEREVRHQEEPCPESCPRCSRLESRLDRLEDERRELSLENRRLWKENAELRERCARYEEREKRRELLPLFDKPQAPCSSERTGKS